MFDEIAPQPDHEVRAQAFIKATEELNETLGGCDNSTESEEVLFGLSVSDYSEFYLSPKLATESYEESKSRDSIARDRGLYFLQKSQQYEQETVERTKLSIFIAGPEVEQVANALNAVLILIEQYGGIFDPSKTLIDTYPDLGVKVYTVDFDVVFESAD